MALKLTTGEELIWKSHPGKRYRRYIFFDHILVTVIIAFVARFAIASTLHHVSSSLGWGIPIGLGCFGLIVSGIIQIKFLTITYFLTNERAIIQRGFFNRDLISVKFEHVLDTKVEQRFSERILGIGTIYLTTANEHYHKDDKNVLTEVPSFDKIDSPFDIHAKLEELVENHHSH